MLCPPPMATWLTIFFMPILRLHTLYMKLYFKQNCQQKYYKKHGKKCTKSSEGGEFMCRNNYVGKTPAQNVASHKQRWSQEKFGSGCRWGQRPQIVLVTSPYFDVAVIGTGAVSTRCAMCLIMPLVCGDTKLSLAAEAIAQRQQCRTDCGRGASQVAVSLWLKYAIVFNSRC